MNIVMRQGWIALGVSIAAMIGRPVKYSNKKNLHLWSSRAQNTKDWYHDVLYSAYVQYSKGSWSWTVLVHIQILILDNFFNMERCSKIFTYNFLCEISQTCHQLQ